jgi:hypothetical protein
MQLAAHSPEQSGVVSGGFRLLFEQMRYAESSVAARGDAGFLGTRKYEIRAD